MSSFYHHAVAGASSAKQKSRSNAGSLLLHSAEPAWPAPLLFDKSGAG